VAALVAIVALISGGLAVWNLRPALAPRVSCPTLVLHSTRDARVPFDEGRLIASLIPGAHFVPLESRNHILLEQEPAWQRWLEEVRAFLPAAPAGGAVFIELTPRERELVELIAQGLDNAQIAARLALSEKTVRNHITSIFAKLQVENRSQAIVLARNAGFGKKTP
jgi:DNA-binding CsgD family transcriptional regulator